MDVIDLDGRDHRRRDPGLDGGHERATSSPPSAPPTRPRCARPSSRCPTSRGRTSAGSRTVKQELQEDGAVPRRAPREV
jgi:hypothetical protein